MQTPLNFQWEEILKHNIDVSSKLDAKDKKILIAPVYGFFEAQLAFESTIAKSLQIRGADVKMLTCGSALPACQPNISGNNKPEFLEDKINKFNFSKNDLCKICMNNLCNIEEKSKIPQIKLSEYSHATDLNVALKFLKSQCLQYDKTIVYKNINISEHAMATTLRVLLRGNLDDDPYSQAVYRRFLISSVMYIEMLERLLDRFSPDSILCVHGVYLEHGILLDLARRENIKVVVWGISYRAGTMITAVNDTYHRQFIEEPDSVWKNLDLNQNQRTQLQKYVASKVVGGRDTANFHPNPILNKREILKLLAFDTKKPIVTLFTNVLWDAQLKYSSNIFDNLLDWIYQTIKFYVENPHAQLAIRIHPAESKGGFSTRQPIAEEIRKMFPALPAHIKVIEPDSNISSIVLSDVSDMSVVYGSNIALEIALRRNPLVIVGQAYCRGKGFSVDPETREDYFKILSDPNCVTGNSDEQVELALRYAYHFFFRRMFDFKSVITPVIGKKVTRHGKLMFSNVNQLINGSDAGLKIVSDLLLNKSNTYFQNDDN